MKILALLFLLLTSPALACIPFVPAIKEAKVSFSIEEYVLSGEDVPLFLKVNFNVEAKADTLLILIDPSDGEILVAGALGACVDGHSRKRTPSVEAARMVIGQWVKNFEDAKRLAIDRGKT